MSRWLDSQVNDRGVLRTFAVVVLATLSLLGRDADAQVLRGTVRLRDDSVAVAGARVAAEDRRGRRLAETLTDSIGRYRLVFRRGSEVPMRLVVSRIGLQPSLTDEFELLATDTIEADLWVRQVAEVLEEVSATAAPTLNVQRFQYATRRGWRVYDPGTIEARRETSMGLNELIQSLGAPGLIVPSRPGDCIKTARNGRCLAIIIDNVLVSGGVHLNPRDIYFLAVVGASDARLEWGDRAAYGALAIYTRMNGDPRRP